MQRIHRGKHTTTVNEKGRIAIPSRVQSCLEGAGRAEPMIFVLGLKPHIVRLYSSSAYQEFATRVIAPLDDRYEEDRILQDYYNNNSADASTDAQGRITIPPQYHDRLPPGSEIVVAGSGGFMILSLVEPYENQFKDRDMSALSEKSAARQSRGSQES